MAGSIAHTWTARKRTSSVSGTIPYTELSLTHVTNRLDKRGEGSLVQTTQWSIDAMVHDITEMFQKRFWNN